jgi:hypothetical protein
VLPAGIREFFLPGEGSTATAYVPVLYGTARVHYADARRAVDLVVDVYATTQFSSGPVAVDWNGAESIAVAPETLSDQPVNKGNPSEIAFRAVPPAAMIPRNYSEWSRDFEQWLTRARPLRLFSAPALKLTSRPGESERDFRLRLQQTMREARDGAVEKLRAKYAPKATRLAERMQKAQETIGREEQQVEQQKLQTAVSMGATVFGALLGRRAISLSTLGRATTAARSVSRSMKEAQDVTRAREKLEQLRAEEKALQAELDADIAALSGSAAQMALEPVEIKPKRGAVDVRLVALVWKPV